MQFHTLDHFEFTGQRVLVRVDLNVPIKDGVVTDRTRIERVAMTIRELAQKGAKVIILSHFGRPNGVDPNFSHQLLFGALRDVLHPYRVIFCADCHGQATHDRIAEMQNGDILLLENIRFYPQEEANDPAFARDLAELGELYVNDAFSVSHRAHVSTAALAEHLPAAAGRLMEAELTELNRILGTARQNPAIAVIGGSKVSTKIDVLTHLTTKLAAILIGGAMANTFLFAQGYIVGQSFHEPNLADTARGIMAQAEKSGCKIMLPVDATIAPYLADGAKARTIPLTEMPSDEMILDIGPDTVKLYSTELAQARTLVWNGPMGAFEFPPFDQGTIALARKAADLTRADKLVSVAGGGDTIAALVAAGVVDDFTYVSTAGGAFLEWLEGRELPGVTALTRAWQRQNPAR